MCLPNALLLHECGLHIFTHYLNYGFSIYWLFLSENCIGLQSVVDILVDFESMYPGFESRESHEFFIIIFFYVFVIIITVQISKFNITISAQILLLYYPLWCPGLQRLHRFDYIPDYDSTV